jgi:transcriptional regulator with XRE-family HTH domain
MNDNHSSGRGSGSSNRTAPRSADDNHPLRKTLSANIKKQRELAGLTQEKLAEKAGISANMINDIEGCRTWVSDKTLEKLTAALKIETYRLFIPLSLSSTEIDKTALLDLAKDLQKIRKDFNSNFETALKTRGIKA